MLLGKRTRKVVAATLLTILVTNTFAPGISYALTSGPTQPEATSFEPIDTTDMVNLQTGNFTYNMPLMDAPGPDGGYPISLSYHSGIQTNEDASWVGLGWTLNTGAISRSVNGYPDDWTSQQQTTQTYWSGGKSTSYQVGVNVGFANSPLSVNAGLSFSQDTYQGFGVGFTASLGADGPLNANIGIGISPYGGGTRMNAGLGLGVGANLGLLNASAGMELQTNFESVSAGFAGSGGVGLISETMSSNQDKPGLAIGGLTKQVTSSSSAGIETEGTSFGISIPVYGFVSLRLGYSKQRYKTDETIHVATEGSINATAPVSGSIADNTVFDTYSLLDFSLQDLQANKYYTDNTDPSIQQGGAYPAFDDYQVDAQGLGGNMRPYQFQGQVFGLNRQASPPAGCVGQRNCTIYNVQYYSPRTTADPMPQFRFVNDFSNTFQQNYDNYDPTQLGVTALAFTPPPFHGSVVTGDGTTSGFSNNHLAGSKHVDMGITVKPYTSSRLGYVKSDMYQTGMIEGFTITNESGVTYTFGLPAYSYTEEAYQERIDKSLGNSLNRQKKGTPYAYTWYLTSVTGPDFVDRNGDGMADDGDWGYWVDFDYGKWTGDYIWRNPSEGYNTDEDNEYQNSAQGHKEVYYLNAVRTRSHVALFEKEVRADAKGESTAIFSTNPNNSPDPTYTNAGLFDNTSASSMRLSHIYLLNAADGNFVTPSSSPTSNGYVLDADDVNMVGRANLEAKSIRVIDFKHDYSLCPNTTNSFTTPGALQGKLTLLNVGTRGKGGVSVMPPTTFQYELATPVSANVNMYPDHFMTTENRYAVGDILISGTKPCGVVTGKTLSGSTWTYTIANSQFTNATGNQITLTTTKNPGYNKDAYDAWGYYKGDLNPSQLATDLNLARQTTPASAPGADAWSLRTITTELGSQLSINYEPNSYFNSSADPVQQSLPIRNIAVNTSTETMVLTIDKNGNNGIHLTDYYSPGSNLNALLLQEYTFQEGSQSYGAMVTDTRANLITFSDAFGNAPKNVKTGVGFGLNYYPTANLFGPVTVTSIDDANSTITVTCSDHFIFGQGTKPTSQYLSSAGTLQQFPSTAVMSNSYGGNLFINSTAPLLGGGVRVSSLSETEQHTRIVRSTLYNYNNSQGVSSGVSAYTPAAATPIFNFPGIYTNFYDGGFVPVPVEKLVYYKSYRRILQNDNGLLFAIGNELPPPGVMYGDVSVSSQVKNPDETTARTKDGSSRTEYLFEVFKGNMVGRVTSSLNPAQTGVAQNYDQSTRYYALDKFVSCIGNIKSIIQYDDKGNKLTETINHYLHDDLINTNPTAQTFMPAYKALLSQYNYQGYIQEMYSEVKLVGQTPGVGNTPSPNGMKATMSAREEYPCISTGQTVINYVNGTRTTSHNLAYDFFSGAVTKTLETDAYGNNIMTETVPAYVKNPAMGLKVTNPGNLNMLTQPGESCIWKVDGSNNHMGLVSATVTTWSNGFAALDKDGSTHIEAGGTETIGGLPISKGNVWRQQSTYSWMPSTPTTDGLTPAANFVKYNWGASSQDPGWIKTTEVTAYDVFSKSLEATDINGNYAATHMTYGESKVMLTGSPAKYYELAYSGAEDDGLLQTNPGFIQKGTGTTSKAAAHTGAQSLLLNAGGTKGFTYTVGTNSLTTGRNYIASVWVKPASGTTSNVSLYYDINGGTAHPSALSSATSQKKAGGWTLVNLAINGSDIQPNATLNVWCRNDDGSVQAYVDDMRFQPLNASTTAYVYDPFSGELTHMLDNSNLYTRFEYDAAGRLAKTYREKINTGSFAGGEFKTNQYLYNYSATKYMNNTAINGPYTKNNCRIDQGYTGSTTTVNIPVNTYTSYIGFDDANALAQKYAQDYANTHGSCTCTPTFLWNEELTPISTQVTIAGSRVQLALVFNFNVDYNGDGTHINIGTLTSSCVFPVGLRTIPMMVGSSVYNLQVDPFGNLVAIWQSGPVITGGASLTGTYDINTNLFYSGPQSAPFQRTNCPSGQVGGYYTYAVPAFQYISATSQQDADNQANADLNANGHTNANLFGPCSIQCSFAYNTANWPNWYEGDITVNGSQVNYSFVFAVSSYDNGISTLGTITGGCVPRTSSITQSVQDNISGTLWNVTIYPSGEVDVQLTNPGSLGFPLPAGTRIGLSGSYNSN